ncbi:beta-carotene 15,15-monooxygenase [Bifidobacterium stellenboschense]|uniref:Beta-carotene 15,15-monooxygenase n=1 Tax=Bifidobacterium stellenboschense TaxID=762211 RepID=A0A087DU89_9BIFI|nr:beta-carotene 15,15-monooxygenase [Bifidobacterium stellenboschense]
MLGVILVVIAVFAFAWFAYGLLGDVGRAACVIVVGAVAVVVAVVLTPRLRVTAEGLAWAGLIALAIGAILISTIGGPRVSGELASLAAGALLFAVAGAGLGLRRIPLPGGLPPLRAYSLYAVFAMPVAVMLMAYALPLPDHAQRFTVESTLAGITAVLLAALPSTDARRRAPDFERIAALVVATVALVLASVAFITTVDYGHDLWTTTALLPVVVAAWAGVLAVTYVRTMTRTGRPMPTGLRFVPVSAIIWVLSISTTLILRMLPTSMDLETRRMWAYLPAVLVAAAAAIAACVLPGPREGDALEAEAAGKDATAGKDGGRPVVSPAERVAAALNGSMVLLIMVCGEFGREGIPPLVTSMAAFVGLLAATAFAWMRATAPTRKPERVRRDTAARPTGPYAMTPPLMGPYPEGPYPEGPYAVAPQPVSQQPVPQQAAAPRPALYPDPSPATQYPAAQYPPSPYPPAYANSPYPTTPYPSAPHPMQQPLMTQPAVAQPTTLQPQVVMVTKARGVDFVGVIITSFTVLATVFLFFDTLIAPRPYAPADLICGAVGAVALAAGVRWMMAWPRVRSWTALWPGLTLLMVPSLLVSWTSPLSFPRALILFGIALAVLLWGAVRGLQAPLIYGTVVLVAHLVTVLWPWLAVFSRQFWWVWLLIGGVILIVAAARYEASLKTMRTLATRIGQLR